MPSSISIAVLTDVHGNGFAAQALATDIRRHAPDFTVNLGDQVWGQANPALAFAVQADLKAVEVRGNNEERLACPPGNLTPEQRQLREWLYTQIPAADLQRLSHLPLTASLLDGAMLFTHGQPRSAWEDLIFNGDTERSDAEIQAFLKHHSRAELVLVGHMHRNHVRTVGHQRLINVTSATYRNDSDPRAGWALLKRCGPQWSVEFKHVDYDLAEARQWIRMQAAHLPAKTQYLNYP